MKLSNVSIVGKIAASFGILLVVMTLLGLTALQRMGAMNANAIDVRDNWLPSATTLGFLLSSVKEYRLAEINQVVDAGSEASRARLAKAVEAEAALRRKYDPLITRGTDDERLVRAFDTQWQDYQRSTGNSAAAWP